jgi:hypothetical protein
VSTELHADGSDTIQNVPEVGVVTGDVALDLNNVTERIRVTQSSRDAIDEPHVAPDAAVDHSERSGAAMAVRHARGQMGLGAP